MISFLVSNKVMMLIIRKFPVPVTVIILEMSATVLLMIIILKRFLAVKAAAVGNMIFGKRPIHRWVKMVTRYGSGIRRPER